MFTIRFLIALLTVACSVPSPAHAADRPNVIFVLADDLGWSELGCYGNTFNETPNIDKLAKQGLRFTDAYAAAPVCSPTRGAFMTGQWPARVGITDYLRPNADDHLSTEHLTLAERFKEQGYATGIIGKWHLTGYASAGAKEVPPSRHGFDETIISESRGIAGGSYFHPYHFNPDIKARLKDEHLVDRVNVEAVEFIQRNKAKPFFLFVSHYAVHTRLAGRPDLVEKYAAKKGAGKAFNAKQNNVHLAAQLELIDTGVGMLLQKLDDLKLADNTLFIFTSDNGGEDKVTSNAPLRAGKSTLYEGGIREPLIVRWPGTTSAGSVCAEPVSTVDFYPTFVHASGGKPDGKQQLDGVSLVPLLRDPKATLKREALYWHYPLDNPHFLGGRSSGAVRAGDWKLIEDFTTDKVELFNLREDLGEKRDVSETNAKKAAELKEMLVRWREAVGAKITKHAGGK
ncbi:MAG: sulfatase [Phycisphaeraceae bacterium]